jgi:ribose 5-phosphate isomerase B
MRDDDKMSDDTIAIACDHGGLDLKELLKQDLEARGLSVLDLGTNGRDSVDYPDFADAMAEAVKTGKAARGVLICGTGIGISIAANRHPEIRAALVHDAFTARMCREHNDANVLGVAQDCLALFLDTPFEGGRHARRVEKMSRPV